MFVTLPQFHQPLMSAVALEGQQKWDAVAADFPAEPWYLFTYKARYIDSRVNHTMLVAWEELLLRILRSVPTQDHRALYQASQKANGELSFRPLDAVWAPTQDEYDGGLEAVFRLAGHSELVGPNRKAVAQGLSRVQLFRRPTAPH